MQNSERQPFEESWRSAFDGANMAPSDKLWRSIEADLAGSETATMKKRVVFYQRLAAATVLFALLSGSYAVYNYRSAPVEVASIPTPISATPPADASSQSKGQVPTSSLTEATTGVPHANHAHESHTAVRTNKKGSGNQNTTAPPSVNESSSAIALATKEEDATNQSASAPVQVDEVPSGSPGLVEVAEPTDASVANNQTQSTTLELLSADQINAIAEARDKEEKAGVSLAPWLGVGAAAGSFAPNAVVNGAMFAAADADFNSYYASQGIPQSYSESVGSAYSAGVSGGIRFAKRWVIQSGMNYINQRVDYTTSFVGISASNQPSAMTKEYISNTNLDVMVTNPYQVSSATEILSIPVQAGFLIIDKRIGWQLSSGVATDFLLRNTLTDKSGARSKVTEGAGEESPYRAVNWAAMLNTELSYRIGDHYRIAVVPGFRYAFKPMLKGDVSGNPLILDVGFRFKYLFN